MAAYTAAWRKVNVIVHNILKLFTTKFIFYFTTIYIELASIEVATVCVVRNLESIQTMLPVPVNEVTTCVIFLLP